MKLAPSKVRVNMPKIKSVSSGAQDTETMPKTGATKPSSTEKYPALDIPTLTNKPKKPASLSAIPIRDDYSILREAALSVQRIKISAQQELEQIKRMHAEALRYHQETATKARSEANQLILHTRLTTQREIEELIRQASEEIQKMLADIRVIRITAQEELAAQKKFTDAAKINSLSLSFNQQVEKTAVKPKKQPVATK